MVRRKNHTKQDKRIKHYGRCCKPHIIGIHESWANIDVTGSELGLAGYVNFRKDKTGRGGIGMLLYIKETTSAYAVQLHE